MRASPHLLMMLVCILGITAPADARSTGAMLDACARVGKSFFREGQARTEMKYNGQRVDGTHAINGDIFLETRKESFACSFDRGGGRMVEFFAEGRLQNAYLPGGGADASGGDMVRVPDVGAGDVLNVRSGPGTNYRILGALGNGDSVYRLRCKGQGRSRWCEIEMRSDMRERGWVNARYLREGAAVQQPSPPPAGQGGTSTERVRFKPGTSGAELSGSLMPGESRRYLLRASNGQDLRARLDAGGPDLYYQIFNPDGSFLLEQVGAAQAYRGQLWQSGDHVVEVINRGNRPRSYQIRLRVR
ncbi:SH3 domain-containing protein [Thiorhodococcus minor]|uniref:SH3 domain-containing protein n=1 Tax=Thiorhodococcus minor TaxID=57489 RepID=A0A6M0JXB1_9GAMM|nr:SH3 domain-containing protein [Thiorhodococcus minor]NEV60957.1 SH3 domain-containing protein [Thiorhodococcus minor]